MMTETDRFIEAGAAVLDMKFLDWPNKIDLDQLRMTTGNRCVVGQLCRSGNFWHSVGEIAGESGDRYPQNVKWAREHGFYLGGEDLIDYTMLEEKWRRLILQRRRTLSEVPD